MKERHVVVCGLGRFGLRLVDELRQRGASVTAITQSDTRSDRLAQARQWGAAILIGDFRSAQLRAEAGEARATALILASSGDAAGLETALEVRAQRPQLPIVMRLTEEKLARRLRQDFGIEAYAPPTLAAPAFVEAALEPPIRESAVPRPAPHAPHARVRRRTSIPLLFFLGLVFLFLLGMAVFTRVMGLAPIDAAYFTITTLATVGYGDINLQKESAALKLFGMFLMIGGVFLVAGITSVCTSFLMSGGLERLRVAVAARRMRGHIIVCGLGSVGEAIVRDLHGRGERVVVVDTEPIHERELGVSLLVPVLVGDATRPEVLEKAGFMRARALIAAVSEDAVNLEIGLVARTLVEELRPERPMRLVLRCFDPDLEVRIQAVSPNYAPLSSARLAAPLFVDKALNQ